MRDPPCQNYDREERNNNKGYLLLRDLSRSEKFTSHLNEILRRGGRYRNGAIVLHLDLSHPDIDDFIKQTENNYPGLSVVLTSNLNGGKLMYI